MNGKVWESLVPRDKIRSRQAGVTSGVEMEPETSNLELRPQPSPIPRHLLIMTAVKPSSTTWTLRLKAHKTTVLLHVDPLSTFSNIKELLYNALEQAGLKHPETGSTIPLPESAADIQLGRPLDVNKPKEGFRLGEWETNDEEEDAEGANGKGKAASKSISQSLKGAGLKDNAVLAFRWKGDGTGWENDEEDTASSREKAAYRRMWGVKIATYEDSYGVQNSGDVGGASAPE